MEVFNKSDNVTLYDLNQADVIKHLPLLIVYVLIMIIGIVGNILVLIIYKLKFKRSSGRVYILFLAGTDLSVCLIGIPYHVLDLTWVVIYSNGYLCKVLSFLIGAATLSSIFVLLVVGLDRYLKVCRSFKKQIRDFGDRRACVIVICVAVIFNIPNGIIYGNSLVTTDVAGINGTECFVSDDFQSATVTLLFLGMNLLIFIIAVAYLTVIYGLIGKTIYDHDKMDISIDIDKKKGCCNCLSADTDSISSDMLDEECNEDIEMSAKTDASTNESVTELNKADATNAAVKAHDDIDLTLGDNQSVIATDKNKANASSKRKSIEANKDTKRSTNIRHIPSGTMIRHVAPGRKNNTNHTRKITIMMLMITIVFILTYLPFIVISILDSVFDDYWSEMSSYTDLFHNFLLRLYLVNNMANPIIYGFWDKKFRTECVKLIRSVCFFNKGTDRKTGNSSSDGTKYSGNTSQTSPKTEHMSC